LFSKSLFLRYNCKLMQSFAERLAEIIKYYHLTHAAFAEKMGIQKSSVSHLLSGRNKPNFDFLARFPDVFPEINLIWLLTGQGEMFNKSVEQKNNPTDIKKTQVTEKLQTPNELIKIYNDGTFEILKRR